MSYPDPEPRDFQRSATVVLNGIKTCLKLGRDGEAAEHIRIALCAASEVGKKRAYKITDMFLPALAKGQPLK